MSEIVLNCLEEKVSRFAWAAAGGGRYCGMFYRLNVIEIVATNEVGTWVHIVARNMF